MNQSLNAGQPLFSCEGTRINTLAIPNECNKRSLLNRKSVWMSLSRLEDSCAMQCFETHRQEFITLDSNKNNSTFNIYKRMRSAAPSKQRQLIYS